ncbi:MAG: winged helix-turn-helix domain-containing protein [archaeon]|nr:winged helix-turn-helix domain-containing protein [archaeon]
MTATRRSRLELVFDILLSIQNKGGKIKPTHLMYKSNLSHKLLNSYLEELLQKGLVEVKEEEPKKRRQKINKFIHITEKGLGFLEEFRRMKEFTNAFGL